MMYYIVDFQAVLLVRFSDIALHGVCGKGLALIRSVFLWVDVYIDTRVWVIHIEDHQARGSILIEVGIVV